MSCAGCAERRGVIAGAVRSAVEGDLSRLAPAASSVQRTLRGDAAALARTFTRRIIGDERRPSRHPRRG